MVEIWENGNVKAHYLFLSYWALKATLLSRLYFLPLYNMRACMCLIKQIPIFVFPLSLSRVPLSHGIRAVRRKIILGFALRCRRPQASLPRFAMLPPSCRRPTRLSPCLATARVLPRPAVASRPAWSQPCRRPAVALPSRRPAAIALLSRPAAICPAVALLPSPGCRRPARPLPFHQAPPRPAALPLLLCPVDLPCRVDSYPIAAGSSS